MIRGQLIVMNGPDRGLDYAIPVGRSELGRAPDAAIPLADVNVSRQHALIESTEQRVVLIDLGSVNGTWVNNRRLNGPCPLRDGDIVAVGAVTLQFRSDHGAALSTDLESVAFDEIGTDGYQGRASKTRRVSRLTPMSLEDEKFMSFTTFRKSGEAVTTPTWIVPLTSGRYGFWTSSATGKVKRLGNNPRVTVQPSDRRGKVKAGSTPSAGSAVVVESGPEFDSIQQQVKAKYGAMVPISRFFNTIGHLGKGKQPYADLGVVITLEG